MNDNPLISILMPVYNGMPLLKASIASLQNQTYSNWECIIVDDGSTDGTSSYLDSLKDSRLRIIHFSQNHGRPIARQKALDEVKGYYVAMLDAEDIYHPCKLEKQLKVFEAHPELDLIGSNMCSFGTQTDILYKRNISESRIRKFDGVHFPVHAASMLKTGKAKQIRYNPQLKLGQDRDFLEKYLQDSLFMELPDILYYYSELDSVSKYKIRKTYKLMLIKYFSERNIKMTLVYLMKCVYSIVVFPWLSIEKILQRRGVALNAEEALFYKQYCYKLIKENLD